MDALEYGNTKTPLYVSALAPHDLPCGETMPDILMEHMVASCA